MIIDKSDMIPAFENLTNMHVPQNIVLKNTDNIRISFVYINYIYISNVSTDNNNDFYWRLKHIKIQFVEEKNLKLQFAT